MRHKRDGWIRRIDVASAIFKCILQDRLKYIQGDYPVAWAHWQRLAQELVLVLGELVLVLVLVELLVLVLVLVLVLLVLLLPVVVIFPVYDDLDTQPGFTTIF